MPPGDADAVICALELTSRYAPFCATPPHGSGSEGSPYPTLVRSAVGRRLPQGRPAGHPRGRDAVIPPRPARGRRSEEHTSDQSRPHLVCRLLLEKKK